jgi:TPP-dependent pyruvate/acetoin dehydrogenase alpha subunit
LSDSPTEAGANGAIGEQFAVELYRKMLIVRGVEDRIQSLFLRGEVYGTTHLCTGQEAVSVGFASALRTGDRVACTYRGHGHALALGTEPGALIAELLGRSTGVNGGLAGSMNIVDPAHGLLGCYGIVGGSIAAATGAALSLRGTGRIAVAYFGDGATNQAYFFECLNFAKVLDLPVVFVCENNGYGEYTPMDVVTAGGIQPRVAAMNLPTRTVDGMDVWAVHAAAAEVTDLVRGGSGPQFVEAITYRFVGHSRSDPGKYRPPGELERWRERDPLVVAAARLREQYGLDESRLEAIRSEVDGRLEALEQEALAAPFPEPVARAEFAGQT